MTPSTKEAPQPAVQNTGRRKIIFLIPFGILTAVFGTLATAAIRFLKPLSTNSGAADWSPVAQTSELKGARPVLKKIVAEHRSAWTVAREEHFVYVLPYNNNAVVSSVCPHEGCMVSWNDANDGFVCPCHDSLFDRNGSRVKGPARRGLDPLPTNEVNGILKCQFRSYANNTEERVIIG
jgi:menaquinol-cytochrome c reductase iron-sulfur subunit